MSAAWSGGPLWCVVARRLRQRLPADRVEPILVDLFDDYRARRSAGRFGSALWLISEARSLEVAYRGHAVPRERLRVESLWRDLRMSVRSLMRTPTVTAAITLTLAIGIGANAAMFAIVNGVLFRPLPYPDQGRVVAVSQRSFGASTDIPTAPYLYFTYRESARTIENVGLWRSGVSTIAAAGASTRPEQAQVIVVTHEVLSLLGTSPALGRVFTATDDDPGAPVAAVLSWSYWQRRFGGDARVVGQPLTIDGMAASVVGVMPRQFTFLDQPVDVIFPFQLDRSQVTLGRYVFQGLARLKPGVTIGSAAADLSGLVPAAIQRFPPPAGFERERFARRPPTTRLTPVKDVVVGSIGRTLWLVMGALAVVLVIACANVAHLLLVRAEGRRRELAVRVALGAGPSRIVSVLVADGLVLGVAGGVVGLLVARVALPVVLTLAGADLPRADDIVIDPLVCVFTMGLSLAAGVWLGVLPVVKMARVNPAPALVDGGRAMSDGRERQRARNVLVVAQIALAIVLLVCSGLMIRTFRALVAVEPGFGHPEQVQLAFVATGQPDPDRTLATQHAIADALAAIPGVESVSYGDRVPLSPENIGGDTVLTVEHSTRPIVDGQPRPLRRFEFIGPAYFRTYGTPVIEGREFTWTDLIERRQTAIVSAELARQEWGGARAAIGQRVQITPADPWREVVGVTADVRDNGVSAPAPPIIYFPARVADFWGTPESAFSNVTFALRSARAGQESLLKDIDAAVARVNAGLPVSQERRLSDVYRGSLARASFTLTLLVVAGAMGLALGVIGIYGVVAHGVSQRAREIAIRLALGAAPGTVTRLFLTRALVLAAVGLGIGVLAAAGLSRLMSSVLFGVTALDPLTYVVVAAVVLVVVTAAAWLPARRAAHARRLS